MAKQSSRFEKIRAGLRALQEERELREGSEHSRFYKFVHFWMLVVRSFSANRCPIRAAALSYTTLLALIPMLAVAISVTTSLLKKEGEQQIYQFVDKFVSGVMPPAASIPRQSTPSTTTNTSPDALPANTPPEGEIVPGQPGEVSAVPEAASSTNGPPAAAAVSPGETNAPEVSSDSTQVIVAQKEVAKQIHEFIQNTQSTAIAGVGMLFLVYMAISMLAQIEGVFNDIWGVTRGRNWYVRIVTYWAAITLGPLLLAAAFGLTSGPYLKATQSFLGSLPVIGQLFFPALTLVFLWLIFAAFYMAVPNTKVQFKAAFVGGIVGGTAWHVNSVFGFLYVSRVVTNSKIYGSLGLVPVFMMGIYLSWLILLFGAQVAYAYQNRSLYLQEKLAENVNQRGREFVALRLLTCVGQRFQHGQRPVTIPEMSGELGIPTRLIQQVLQTLVAAHLVIEIAGAEPAYTPARPLEDINAHHVLQAMRATQGQELITRDEPVREDVYGEFARIQEAEKQVASKVTLLDLVHRTHKHQIAPPAEEEARFKPAFSPSVRSAEELSPPSAPEAEPSTAPEPDQQPDTESQPVESASAPKAEAPRPDTREDQKPTPEKPVAKPPTDEERNFPL